MDQTQPKRKLRRFTWAEIMWIEYCAKTGKSAAHCVANMIDRDKGSVINKAASMGIPFHDKAGAKVGHPAKVDPAHMEYMRSQKASRRVVIEKAA